MSAVRQLAKSKELAIETAVKEALANAIKHGCCGDSTKFVQCSVGVEDDHSVSIVVSDPGPGFDTRAASRPLSRVSAFCIRIMAAASVLIRHLMDEVRFKRGGAGSWYPQPLLSSCRLRSGSPFGVRRLIYLHVYAEIKG